MTGYIHSMESMGLVDGPGVRAVVFLQGCPLRCRYCHNPDTQCRGGRPVEDGTLVRRLLRFRSYFDRSGGGVTFSGGEPLAQPDFLLACLRRLKAEGVHTCLDTSGAGRGIDPCQIGQVDRLHRLPGSGGGAGQVHPIPCGHLFHLLQGPDRSPKRSFCG